MGLRAGLAQLLFLVLLQQMMRFMRGTAAFQACQWPPSLPLSFRARGSAAAFDASAPMPFGKERLTSFSSTAWSRSRTSVRMSYSYQPSLTTAPISSHSIPSLDNPTKALDSMLFNETAFKTTRYTIDYCPRTDPVRLQRIVDKHATTLDRYLSHKPIAHHTLAAFQELCRQLQSKQQSLNASSTHGQYSIVLDSGCGTGRSSLVLGRLYPQHTVVGVDRSVARLSKQKTVVQNRMAVVGTTDNCNSEDTGLCGENDPDEGVLVQQVAGNVCVEIPENSSLYRASRR
jgi:hypothetical protein